MLKCYLMLIEYCAVLPLFGDCFLYFFESLVEEEKEEVDAVMVDAFARNQHVYVRSIVKQNLALFPVKRH